MNSNKHPKVTVTVPVYNTEKYLRKSLDSLLNQTLKEIEVILIDDGSTDSSGLICDEYAALDSRIKVIHKQNGGSASARQAGLEAASGEYITVCDSDDWVDSEMYEKLYDAACAANADIVMCDLVLEYADGRSAPLRSQLEAMPDGTVENYDFFMFGCSSTCNKMVKKSLFDRTGAFYEPGINMGEDVLILYKLFNGNPRVVYLKESYYHYRRIYKGSSYTNRLNMDSIRQMEFVHRWLKDNYSQSEFDVSPKFYQSAVGLAIACMRAVDLDESFLKEFVKSELPWKRITFRISPVKYMIVVMLKVLPLWLSLRLFRFFYPLFYR